jgi:hypothetical protein
VPGILRKISLADFSFFLPLVMDLARHAARFVRILTELSAY